jgi:iron-sulfur cluster repair protein YtfE (RIC family)
MLISIGAGPRKDNLELVDLLLACHARIRRFSKAAVELGRRADLAGEEVVEECRRCERYFGEALPLHVEDEESRLLPRLLGRRLEVDQALSVMERQHKEHQELLSELLSALRSLRAFPTGANERATLYRVAKPLAEHFEEHLRGEETIVFSAVRDLIPRDVQGIVIEELRARRRLAHRSLDVGL